MYFSKSEILKIRKRAKERPEYIERILASTKDIRETLYIQKTGLADWGHYYMCPVCTKRLVFNYRDAENHRCGTCGRVYTGEPYCGAWWRAVLGMNAEGSFSLAVAYLATEKKEYLDYVCKILTEYADNYKNYEVHGNIPYNHPGRLAAQVLCDSMCVNSFARAYGIIKDSISKEQREHIEKDFLVPAAEFIKSQMTYQIHNHEVFICSAIGVVGIVTGTDSLIEFALNGKYGLKYQLAHAVLEDGLWFEGSMGYHFFALRGLMIYEMVASNTPNSLFADPKSAETIYKMLDLISKLRDSNDEFPKINDGSAHYTDAYMFEFLASKVDRPSVKDALARYLRGSDRLGVYSLLYGIDDVPEIDDSIPENYFTDKGSRLAIINSPNRTFVLKALPYGGEHDHYDRMGISFSAFGKGVCADMGTASGYGAPLHYAYFKNTATHNTVVINGDNMPPANTDVIEYSMKAPNDIIMRVKTEWNKDFVMPDSFTIKQWVDESYDGVKMYRSVKWCEDYFIDVFRVETNNRFSKEWIWHTDGELTNPPKSAKKIESPWTKEPQKILKDVISAKEQGVTTLTYDCGDLMLNVYCYTDGEELLFAKGPNNPSVSDISYLAERSFEENVTFVNVIEAYKGESKIDKVSVSREGGKVSVVVTNKDLTTVSFCETFD